MTTALCTAEPLAQVQARSVRWLWEPYVPRGKLALLDGDPGVGKSVIALDLAARLSQGGPLPMGGLVDRPHVTLLFSAEDNSADTIRPRAEAAGADLSRVIAVTATDGDLLSFPADLGSLERLVHEHAADLVVIDPVMAFLPPEIAASSDQCVRGTFKRLAALAERTDCTVLLIRHLRKRGAAKALYRGMGSIGIIGAVRAGLLAASLPGDPELRVLAVTKTNLGATPPALGFRLRSDSSARVAVEWAGPLDVSADALGLPAAAALKMRDRAVLWLDSVLADGPRPAVEIYALAAEAGIPERTLERAKHELHARSEQIHIKEGKKGEGRNVWYWYDPAAPWPKDAPFARPYELPPLEPLDLRF